MLRTGLFSRFVFPALTLGALAPASAAAHPSAPPAPLVLKVYHADAASFNVTSVVVSGPTEAVVIDAGFTRADALRIAANVLDSGKTLKAILISNADPDFYFGAATLRQLFPGVPVLSTPAVREKIAAKLAAKMAFWAPKMGTNAPVQPLLPDVLAGASLTVDGAAIEVRGTSGALAHRPYVWIPSLRAVVGNIAVFGGLHVWTADTATPALRQAWLAQLDEMAALAPALVVPGHMAAGTATDADAGTIDFTRSYLRRFDAELARAHDAAGLIAAMQVAYPQLAPGLALDIGAKVNKGEMDW
jgi:glyoxylase-like metal-dependent hydrolase (beta-lactamase superfamily II)